MRGGLLLGSLSLALLALACDGGPSAAPTATFPRPPTATATPDYGEEPGAEGFRAFAAQVQAALDAQDAVFFRDRLQPMEGTCTDEDIALNLLPGVCEELGKHWTAFPVGYWRSEGVLVPAEEALGAVAELWATVVPNAADGFGGASPRVFALTLSQGAGEDSTTVLTSIIERPPDFAGEGPLRIVRVLHWSFDGERWRLTRLLVASVLAEEFLVPCSEALAYTSGSWERYPDADAPRVGDELCPP